MTNNFKDFLSGFKTLFQDLTTKGRRRKQIPNLITLSRLAIACFIPPLALSGSLIAATIVTVIAALTDAIDGIVARKLDAKSEFGKNLDPVCDKLFAGILIVPLLLKMNSLMTIGLGFNLVLEGFIASVNLNSKAKGNEPVTTYPGKVKTAMLSILLGISYLSFSVQIGSVIIPLVYCLTTISQIIALIDYYKIDKNKDSEKRQLKKISEINQINSLEENKNLQYNPQKNYTASDYKNLKSEIEKIYNDEEEKDIPFQKIKK